MSEQHTQWLGARPPFTGLAAWSLRRADGTFARQCYADWLTPAQVDQALARLGHSVETLEQHKLRGTRLCWAFEHLRLYYAAGRDGAGLALFVENRPEAQLSEAEAWLNEFEALGG
jgi:hypothetical protein